MPFYVSISHRVNKYQGILPANLATHTFVSYFSKHEVLFLLYLGSLAQFAGSLSITDLRLQLLPPAHPGCL